MRKRLQRIAPRAILVLIGFLPLLPGYILASMQIMPHGYLNLKLMVLGVGMLAFWFFVSCFGAKHFKSKREVIFLLNAAAILFCSIILVQHYANGELGEALYKLNSVAKNFYLPMAHLGSWVSIAAWVAMIQVFTAWFYAPVAFVLMVLASFLGTYTAQRRIRERTH